MLSIKAPVATEADNILGSNLLLFSKQIRHNIYMIYQDTFFPKNKMFEKVDKSVSILHGLCNLYKSIQNTPHSGSKELLLFQDIVTQMNI